MLLKVQRLSRTSRNKGTRMYCRYMQDISDNMEHLNADRLLHHSVTLFCRQRGNTFVFAAFA